MKTRNKWLLGILCACVLALLIALCFVGNTFARYTLNQKETVSADIAEWGVTVDDSSVTDHKVTVSDLRPSSDKYTEGGSVQRTKVAQFTQVAVLKNTGDVSATVTIAESSTVASSATYQDYDSTKGTAYGATYDSHTNKYTPGEDCGYGGSADTTTGSEYASEIGDHIKADVYYSTKSDIKSADSEDLSPLSDDGITLKSSKDTENTEEPDTIYIYLDVEWISDLADTYDTDGVTPTHFANGDGFDTWCGMWVEGFSFDITIEAYQAS